MSERCKHDMEPGTCSWCTGRDGGEQEMKAHDVDLLRRGLAFGSSYPGHCAGCGSPFSVGTPITNARGRPGWVASCCIDENGRHTR